MTPKPAGSAGIRVRSFAFVVVSVFTSVLFVLTYPVAIVSMRTMWAIVSVHIRLHVFYLRAICGVDYRITGMENLPDGPCILASRHEAMWETIFLPWIFGNPAVFLKSEILQYPVAGLVARTLDYIGVDRSGDLEAAKRSFAKARRMTEAGRSVLIFPSGTRDPAHRTRVQAGVAVLYRQVKLPCVPIILNSGEHWVYKSWLRVPGTIRVEVLPAIPAGLPTKDFMARLEHDLALPVGFGQAKSSGAIPSVARPSSLGISDSSDLE